MIRRRHNAPTMQTVQRVNGQLYQTLDVRRLRNASPLQTDLPARRRISLISIVLIAIIIALIALAIASSNAHAQTIGEPWCEIGSAPRPAIACIQPRVFLPAVQTSEAHIS